MKLRPFLVPAILLTVSGGLVGWLLLADPPEISRRQAVALLPSARNATEAAASSGNTGAVQTPEQETAAAAPLPADIRNVSPEGVSAPKVSGHLTRVEPSKAYLELKNPPVEPIPDGPLELTRVQVLDSGRIKSDRLVVTLAYIKPLAIDETCVSRLGGSWPCGTRARTFLRGLIRQLKITCEKIEELGPGQILGTCKRGQIDLSARLVRYGWADPTPDAPTQFAELARKAKERKIGKWQSEWLNVLPKSGWDNDATAALPGLEDLEQQIVEWSQPVDSEQPEPEAPFPFEPDTDLR